MADTASARLRREIEATDLPAGLISLWSLGNLGFVFKAGRGQPTLAFDPYLTDSIEHNQPGTEFVRAFAPPLQPEDLAVDAVLITHEHDDHLDLATLVRALAARSARALPSTCSARGYCPWPPRTPCSNATAAIDRCVWAMRSKWAVFGCFTAAIPCCTMPWSPV